MEPEQNPIEPVDPVESVSFDDTRIVEALSIVNENLYYTNAFLVLLMCLILFGLFFVGLKAGKK